MRNLVIFGDTAFAKRLLAYIKFEGVDKVIAFTQERKFLNETNTEGLPVIPFEDLRKTMVDEKFSILIAIGYTKMNDLREQIYNLCIENGYSVASYISSNAICYSQEIGEGTIILPGTLIGPGCSLGKCNIFESSCAISHDSKIGDFNFFSTNVVVGGFANVRNHCFVGLNSTIKSDIDIENYSLIGMSSGVTKSITDSEGVYIGIPAKRLENKNSRESVI